jgi:hypothetical protein
MNNEVIENLVSRVVQSYKFVGFVNDTIHERDLFLSLLTCVLVKSSDLNSLISEFRLKNTENDFLKAVTEHSTNKSLSLALQGLLVEISDLIKWNNPSLAVHEVFQFSDDSQIRKLIKLERITLYDRVLQRLQAMNLPDQFASDFSYQSLPFNFAELYTKLLQPKKNSRVYDPYAMTGESIVDFALLNNDTSVTTESVNQSSRYIQHKLLIAGASENHAKNSFALEPKSNVNKGEFDYACTLLQPNISAEIEDITGNSSRKLKGNFEEKRIPKSVVKSRFWEHALIHHMLYSLNDSGKAIIITGKGPLSRHSDFHSRKILADKNLIDGVIQLPEKLLDTRTVSLFAIILNKRRSNKDKIILIDARDCCTSESGINKLTNIDDIANAYRVQNSQSLTFEIVTPASIIEKGYSFNVDTYLSSEAPQHEDINAEETQQALLRQQRITDAIIKKLNYFIK